MAELVSVEARIALRCSDFRPDWSCVADTRRRSAPLDRRYHLCWKTRIDRTGNACRSVQSTRRAPPSLRQHLASTQASFRWRSLFSISWPSRRRLSSLRPLLLTIERRYIASLCFASQRRLAFQAGQATVQSFLLAILLGVPLLLSLESYVDPILHAMGASADMLAPSREYLLTRSHPPETSARGPTLLSCIGPLLRRLRCCVYRGKASSAVCRIQRRLSPSLWRPIP